MEKLLTQEETAKVLATAESTLENWRCTRKHGPKFVKVGRLVRYRQSDLEKFLRENTVTCGADSN